MNDYCGKWSVSTNEEYYHGIFDTVEEAIQEGHETEVYPFWVGQCMPPVQPEELWFADDWLENVWCHDDYSGDWAEGSFSPSNVECLELEAEVRNVIAKWLDKNQLRPTHWNIDLKKVRKILAEEG